jgi:acetylglutamate kinase
MVQKRASSSILRGFACLGVPLLLLHSLLSQRGPSTFVQGMGYCGSPQSGGQLCARSLGVSAGRREARAARHSAVTSVSRPSAAVEELLKSLSAERASTSMQGEVVVVKYGGHAMKDEAGFAADLVELQSLGVRPVVVHGGGPQIKEMLGRLEMPSKFEHGLRVSDEATVAVAEMVLGRLNKGLVAAIVAAGGRAVGLSGKDDGMIKTRRVLAEGGIDIGFVGEAEQIDTSFIDSLLSMSKPMIPVIAPLGTGTVDGETYNINADTMAGAVAGALKAKRLLLLTDVPGVLDAAPPEGKLLPRLTKQRISDLIADGTVYGGMIPKLQNAVEAVEAGAGGAAIVDGRVKHALFHALFSDTGGTLVEADANE